MTKHKILEIRENEVGKEFLDELKKVIEIRKERRKIYGDSFLREIPQELMSIINGKKKRFEILYAHKERPRGDDVMKKIYDEMSDLVNYYLFLLCVIRKEEKLNGNNITKDKQKRPSLR